MKRAAGEHQAKLMFLQPARFWEVDSLATLVQVIYITGTFFLAQLAVGALVIAEPPVRGLLVAQVKLGSFNEELAVSEAGRQKALAATQEAWAQVDNLRAQVRSHSWQRAWHVDAMYGPN